MKFLRSLRAAANRTRKLPLRGIPAVAHQPATWVPPGHFYSPLVDTEKLRARADTVFAQDAPVLDIDLNLARQHQLFGELAEFYPDLPFDDQAQPGLRYKYLNDAFGYGDAIILATMLRRFRPKRIIEVGSGHSSCVILDINERFFDNSIACTFVEPYPELLFSLMKAEDRELVTVIPKGVQEVGTELFATLEPGDFLFIDSTHISKSDSDVNHHFFRVLPSLKDGVFIHFHDIFYPFEYPREWFFDENRSWNELYLLRAFLMNNPRYEIIFFNSSFVYSFKEMTTEMMPKFFLNSGGSFWMRKLQN